MTLDLFLISFLTLFLELTCIRWFPSHVLFLTFFTNTVLLASILGIAVGCLAAKRKTQPAVVDAADPDGRRSAARISSSGSARSTPSVIDVGNQASPQMVFFGVEYQARDLSSFVIPIEAICGYFFLLIALAMMGPGQQLGRALARMPNRLRGLHASTFSAASPASSCSRRARSSSCRRPGGSAWCWPASSYFLRAGRSGRALASRCARAGRCVLVLSMRRLARGERRASMWSPYYRIDYHPRPAADQRQPDRPPADAAAHRAVPRLRAAAPAQSRRRRQAVRPGADHRRRLRQRRQPRAGVGRRARRRGRDRSGHSAASASAIIPIVRTTIRASPCISTTAATS